MTRCQIHAVTAYLFIGGVTLVPRYNKLYPTSLPNPIFRFSTTLNLRGSPELKNIFVYEQEYLLENK